MLLCNWYKLEKWTCNFMHNSIYKSNGKHNTKCTLYSSIWIGHQIASIVQFQVDFNNCYLLYP